MDFFPQFVGLGVLLLALWVVFQPRPVFEVRIDGGTLQVARGKVTAAFLGEIREVCDAVGVQRGKVRGYSRGRRIALGFSGDIPPQCQQRLRNLWAIHG